MVLRESSWKERAPFKHRWQRCPVGRNSDRRTLGVGRQEKSHFMKVSNDTGFGLITELCTSISAFWH